jgi:hypothetical protein
MLEIPRSEHKRQNRVIAPFLSELACRLIKTQPYTGRKIEILRRRLVDRAQNSERRDTSRRQKRRGEDSRDFSGQHWIV